MRAVLIAGLLLWMGALGVAQRAQPAPPSGPAGAPPILTPASADGFERTVKPFLAKTCVECHGNEVQKRDLNFEKMTSVDSLLEHRERWDDVVQKLREREMP